MGRWSGDPPGASGPSTSLGPWRRADLVPLAWEVIGLHSLIPSLDGDVELAPLGPDHCRVTLSASYVPPFGELGVRLDHALMRHVAASTLRSFLARVAVSIQDQEGGSDADIEPAIKRVEKPENWTLDESEYGGEG